MTTYWNDLQVLPNILDTIKLPPKPDVYGLKELDDIKSKENELERFNGTISKIQQLVQQTKVRLIERQSLFEERQDELHILTDEIAGEELLLEATLAPKQTLEKEISDIMNMMNDITVTIKKYKTDVNDERPRSDRFREAKETRQRNDERQRYDSQ